jgi:formylmethanofuran dehydrogenase subunit C
VSGIVTLTLRAEPDVAIELDGVTPDRLASLSEREIAALPVFAGPRTAALGDFFDVRGGRSPQVRFEGTLTNVNGIAATMNGGEVLVEGDAGDRVGADMKAGSLDVRGSVGDDAGMAMAGGVLTVTGDAGDRLGAAAPGAAKGMTGGEIIVHGSAGADAGARARRGLIVVGGDTGSFPARAMIAGTLVVVGRTGSEPGRSSKRGTIIAVGGITVPESYWFACTFRPPHVRLTMTYLRRHYRVGVDERIAAGLYRRHCGDAGAPGRGEILEWVGP